MTRSYSAAMTGDTHASLAGHLLRDDGQEDICLVLWRPSTGEHRRTHLVVEPVFPADGERRVHRNATVTGTYVLRAATRAAELGCGVGLAHSHPRGGGHQMMSGPDYDAEQAYAALALEVTGHPLLGLTLAGDGSWSARVWADHTQRPVGPLHAESVRIVTDQLAITWNPALRPAPKKQRTQTRTLSTWGERAQADLARRRICVVGAGSVGLDIIVRLAASGVAHLVVIDHDIVKLHNLDRLIGATLDDVEHCRSKVEVAAREAHRNATAADFQIETLRASIADPGAFAAALDCDLIFSCVDRPWPRAVLNQLPYSDLIPVIDGGIAITNFADGRLRGATWRAHVCRPSRPCLICNKQLDPGLIALDREGLLDDPTYIAGAAVEPQELSGQNVAVLSINAAAMLLATYVSFSVAPGGYSEPGPLQYNLSTHHLETLSTEVNVDCAYEAELCLGDRRTPLTSR